MQELGRQQELDTLWKDKTMENVPMKVEAPLPNMQPENDAMMIMIERVAANPNADIEKMQKLLDMRTQEFARVAKQQFYADFAAMQAELPQIGEKTKAHNSKYASFEDINRAVQPILTKYGFAISFRIKQEQNQIVVTAVLSHKGSHTETTDISLPYDTGGSKNSVQAVGSSTSYGKRYAMCAILNIVTCGEDDDGKGSDSLASPVQQKAIQVMVDKLTPLQKEAFTNACGSVNEIKKSDVDKVIARLKKSIEVK
jgi:hypothetical protein